MIEQISDGQAENIGVLAAKPKNYSRLFTSETAAEFGRRSAIARKLKKEQAAQAKLEAELARAEAVKNPLPASYEFAAKTLKRVRKQLVKLFEFMEAESDPQKIDRLASALARLAELERQLSGRPLPGSLKPRQEKSRPATSIEPEL